MKITPEELYSKLVDEFKIFEKKGNIFFELGNIDIVVKRRDVVGNIIQEWLYEWLRRNDIEFEQDDSQLPPDLFLDPENKTNNLVEVKAFNSDATPAFDISDPITFLTDITKRPYMLHTKYLIFAYKMDENTGVVTV
jgi:NgoBV restriction endonuclease